jgi:hydroxymethylbilane synthase
MKARLVIGSRGSKLALWQAEFVRTRIAASSPALDVRVEVLKTSGDVLKDAPLTVIGGQGAFTKELEQALLDGRIDLAVHSLKDLPTVIPDGLTLAAVAEREDPRDSLVLPASAARRDVISVRGLPPGAVVGTSSPRRRTQLKHLRPDLVLKDLRGNIDTRLRKLDTGEFDALVLAAAGLLRLGLHERIAACISTDELLPAVGQGALGLEARADDERTVRLAAQLDHPPTRAACAAERALLRQFGSGCQVPVAAYATVFGHELWLEGLVADASGDAILKDSVEGRTRDAEGLGERLGMKLRALGASLLLGGEVVGR